MLNTDPAPQPPFLPGDHVATIGAGRTGTVVDLDGDRVVVQHQGERRSYLPDFLDYVGEDDPERTEVCPEHGATSVADPYVGSTRGADPYAISLLACGHQVIALGPAPEDVCIVAGGAA